MSPTSLHKLVELVAEIEELTGMGTTFIYGKSDTDIIGVLITDKDTAEDILGGFSDPEAMN